eukprot:4369002-Pyramimonas_sp.AAC.1
MDEYGQTASPVAQAPARGATGREDHPLCNLTRGVEEAGWRDEGHARRLPPPTSPTCPTPP